VLDLGPNLGAINRSALIAASHVVVPLAPDLFSLRGLNNLGPAIRSWRRDWTERLSRNPVTGLALPAGQMAPAGYVVLMHGTRLGAPVQAYDKWISRFPATYRERVLGEDSGGDTPSVSDDPHCLAMLRHYRSLAPLAQEARKPMFHLKPADGAIGAHMKAVRDATVDYHHLAIRIAVPLGLAISGGPQSSIVFEEQLP
jgi:chromosome partitioning protein